MPVMKFRAAQAGVHWRGAEWLAPLCEQADLFVDQAEAARLATAGLGIGALARALSVLCRAPVPRRQARRWALQAEARLKRTRPDLVRRHRDQAAWVLECVRNVRPAQPLPHVYRERWFGYDREPVSLRSRLHGEAPEDLTRRPLRFLRDLGTLLAESAACD
jgi:hypothetical protein